MTPLPSHRPKHLSLGPLESEILNILWDGLVTVKEVHERILADPDRELAYASVTTVLQRLCQKGWIDCDKTGQSRGNKSLRSFKWRPLLTRQEAQALIAYDQLQRFLSVGNLDVVAAFADTLDQASLEQLEAITAQLQAARRAREQQP